MTELIGATALFRRDVKDELPLGSESSAYCLLLLLLYNHPNRCVDVQRRQLEIINNGGYMMLCGLYKLHQQTV